MTQSKHSHSRPHRERAAQALAERGDGPAFAVWALEYLLTLGTDSPFLSAALAGILDARTAYQAQEGR